MSSRSLLKIPAINGLRGFAILIVIVFHLFYLRAPLASHPLALGVFTLYPFTVYSNFFQGVGLLFLLSGFVLMLPFARGQRTIQSPRDIVAFYIRRARRLLPLYYCAILTLFLFFNSTPSFRSFLWQFSIIGTATHAMTNAYFFPPGNRVLWTMSHEIWFSILFPFILLISLKWGMRKTVMVFVGGALAARLAMAAAIMHWHAFPFPSDPVSFYMDNLLMRVDDFVIGMGLAYAYARHRKELKEYCTSYGFMTMMLIIGFYLRDLTAAEKSLYYRAISNLFVTTGFAWLVALVLVRPNVLTRYILESFSLQLMGLMCFSLYVWHDIPIRFLHPEQGWGQMMQYLLLMVGFSLLSYRYIEFGHVKKLKQLLPQRSKKQRVQRETQPLLLQESCA